MLGNRRVLIIEENGTVPLDTRVWQEATTLRDAGWSVTVICPAPLGVDPGRQASRMAVQPEDLHGITVYRFPLIFATGGVTSYLAEYLVAAAAIVRLSWRVWRQNPFNIIHFCNPPDIFFPLAILFRLLGARVVFDHHDLFPEMIAWRYSGMVGRLLYAAARLAEYFTFHSANAIISTNQSYRQIALVRGRVSENRVVILRNGPKSDEFGPVEPVAALRQGSRYLACFAGLMGFEDGILELLSSIRYIVHECGRRDILFALLGDGPIRPQALAQMKAWGLGAVVDMPGMILDRLVLRQYLSTADVCLSPEPLTPLNAHSTFIKIGEYMAVGKPIVAYDLQETRYTAQEAAIYIAPGNVPEFSQAILALLADPEQRRRMGEFGRERFLNCLSWEHQKQHLFQAYTLAMA